MSPAEILFWVWLGVSAVIAIVSAIVMGNATFEGKPCSRAWLRLVLFSWAWPAIVAGLILWESFVIAGEAGQLAVAKWRELFPYREPYRLGPERGPYRTRDAVEVVKQIANTIYRDP